MKNLYITRVLALAKIFSREIYPLCGNNIICTCALSRFNQYLDSEFSISIGRDSNACLTLRVVKGTKNTITVHYVITITRSAVPVMTCTHQTRDCVCVEREGEGRRRGEREERERERERENKAR